jgi:phosphatidylglycerophosphate synthase
VSSPTVTERRSRPHRAIVAELASAQKSNRGAPGYSRWVNRPLGRQLAAAAFRAGMTPNGVTAVSALFTFAGIVVVATVAPAAWTGVAVALLLIVGFALDSADGQLARLTGRGSLSGEWLDHVVDCAKTVSLHLAVLIGWFRFVDQPDGWLLVPVLFAIEATVFFFAIILAEQLVRRAGAAQEQATTAAPVARSLLVLPADYGLLCLAFVVSGLPTVFVPLYSVLMVLNVGILLAALPRWFRRLSAIS